MVKYLKYDEFGDAIDNDSGIHTTVMGVLREAHGVGKLGVNVRQAISDELASRGIGTIPAELPSYQEEEVRLYRLGSTTAKVIGAVTKPSAAGDKALRDSTGTDSQAIVKQIRELVGE